MIRFAQPQAFALALLLFPIALALLARRGGWRPRMLFSSVSGMEGAPATLRMRLRPAPVVLSLAAFALLIVALARPQAPMRERSRMTEGIDIMLAIDVSESMRALDFKPNRLENAKEVVKEFVAGRTDDRIGVVIFGYDTFTLCPLTRDYTTVVEFVDRIDFDLIDGQATAIGMGLANAVNKLKDSKAKSRVVILLTDGENNAGQIHPLMAAEIAKQLNVRVYTIGVGSEGMVQMPVRLHGGGWVVHRQPSRIDRVQLRQIADGTGGRFFMATDGDKLEEIYREIDALERTRVEVSETNFFDELGHLLILPALLLFGLGFFLEQSWLASFP
jgi:Ca-activated chloride channel homolog